jgi:outer membrane protein, heavy metal efflux system
VTRRLLSLALLLAPSFVSAQALPLDAVLRSVDTYFPLVIAADRDRDAADGEFLAAEGAFDPQWRTRAAAAPVGYYNPLTLDTQITQPTRLWGAQLFAGYRFGQGLSYTGIPIYDGKLETNDYGEARAGLTVPLLRNGPIDRARANLQRAEHGRTVAEMGARQQRLEASRAATLRYWEWVAAGRRLAVANTLMGLATTRDAGLAERVARGDLPEFERADNRRAIVQREGAVVSARRALEQAAIELSLYLRNDRGEPRMPTPDELPPALTEPAALDVACVDRASRDASGRRPEPARFEAQRERERVEQRWAANQRLPAIDVSVAASQDLGPGPQSRGGVTLEAGVMVDIPILNRTATGREQAASAAMGRAEAQRRFAVERVNADVRDALSALEAARQRVEVARREVELSRDLAAREQERFAAGDGTLLVLNLRETAAAEAGLREVDALLDWRRAAAAWHFALGRPQGEGVYCVSGG